MNSLIDIHAKILKPIKRVVMALPNLALNSESDHALYFLMIMVDIYEGKMIDAQTSTENLIALLKISANSDIRNVRNAHNDFMGSISDAQRAFLAKHHINNIAHAFSEH